MRLLLTTVLFMWSCSAVLTQEDKTSTVEIAKGKSDVLTVENFQRIRTFVLAGGQRQTYCNMYSHNPSYKFSAFNLYLNPPDQGNINCEIGKSDFPEMVIRTTGSGGGYWRVKWVGKDGGLILTQHHSTTAPGVLTQEVESFFRTALAEIEEAAAKKKVNDGK